MLPLLIAAFAGGTALKAYGEYKSNKDAASASKYNAALYDQQAGIIEAAKSLDIYRLGIAKKKTLGTQRTQYAKAGVTSDGTPLEVMADTAFNYDLDSAITAYNYDIQKFQAKSQADQLRKQASIFKRQSIISPLLTMFSGAASASSGGFSGSNQINTLKDTGGGSGTYIQTTSGGGYRA